MRIYFNLEAGWLIRRSVRQELKNYKSLLEFDYPGCQVLLTENDGNFYFEAKNLPDSAESRMRKWMIRLKSLEN